MRWEVIAEPIVEYGTYVTLNCRVVGIPIEGSVEIFLDPGEVMKIIHIESFVGGRTLYTVELKRYLFGEAAPLVVERYTIDARCFDILGQTPF
jgi:hypothetical protein